MAKPLSPPQQQRRDALLRSIEEDLERRRRARSAIQKRMAKALQKSITHSA